jgi:hypothetical protein
MSSMPQLFICLVSRTISSNTAAICAEESCLLNYIFEERALFFLLPFDRYNYKSSAVLLELIIRSSSIVLT